MEKGNSDRPMSNCVLSEIAYGSAAYQASVVLRDEVLRKPLGLKFTDEELEQEQAHHHLVGRQQGEIIACLILAPVSAEEAKIRQVAVAPHARRQGVGRALTMFAEEFARQHGFTKLTLHARATAVPFYDKLGYEHVGEEFEEVTIPHRRMQKQL